MWRLALGVCGLLLLAAPNAALAQQYPPSSPELTTSTSEASPGDPVTLSGGGYAGNSDSTITFESVPVVLTVVRNDAAGRFTTQVRVPTDATPGTHTFRATGVNSRGGPHVLTAAINVRAGQAALPGSGAAGGRATPGRSGGLARTGSSGTVPTLAAAVALIAAGALLVLQVRREAQPTRSG